jgi:ACR3 family arsenite efflux pump ArsB
MKHKTISRSIQMIIIAALLYAVFIIFSNIDQTVELIAKFPILIFMTMVVFALINYLIRYLKWEYYLRAIGVHVPCSTSILCFLSGFSMTLTPAKSENSLNHGY